ncbi:hypothetical protein ZWY2020_004150 [Hordeum vulgare]|nr:hypothetical protein ZWY2020_004150 [Hordeum vulgare]
MGGRKARPSWPEAGDARVKRPGWRPAARTTGQGRSGARRPGGVHGAFGRSSLPWRHAGCSRRTGCSDMCKGRRGRGQRGICGSGGDLRPWVSVSLLILREGARGESSALLAHRGIEAG